MSSWPKDALSRTRGALVPLANAPEAEAMAAYMKHVAPFLGVRSSPRRRALAAAWSSLDVPRSDELGEACVRLMGQREREFHYAAYDLIERHLGAADEYFLSTYVEALLTTTPWWDTVDGLGSTAVSPLCWRYDAREIVLSWSESSNVWLNRAAIQHQRGWRANTDVAFVLALCHAHAARREFFVAKAIGWALRDLSRLDPTAVRRFLTTHPELSPVAVREARRGLER